MFSRVLGSFWAFCAFGTTLVGGFWCWMISVRFWSSGTRFFSSAVSLALDGDSGAVALMFHGASLELL